jgi:hypothetical protein
LIIGLLFDLIFVVFVVEGLGELGLGGRLELERLVAFEQVLEVGFVALLALFGVFALLF